MSALKPKARTRINTTRRLYRYLRRGGLLIRDENTGSVGPTWARPSRSGEHYADDIVSRLITKGCSIDGQEYHLVKTAFDSEAAADGVKTYHLIEMGE